jgi:hypothetical protein
LAFLLLGSICCCDHLLPQRACLRDQIADLKKEGKYFSN